MSARLRLRNTTRNISALPQMSVGDRHRERVGGIGAGHRDPGQQHLEHRLDLRLLRPPGADHRLLDQPRGVLGDRQRSLPASRQHRAARLRQLERRLRVLVEEHFLDRRAVGRVGRRSPRRSRRADDSAARPSAPWHRSPPGRWRHGSAARLRSARSPSRCTTARDRGRGSPGEDQPSFSITSSDTS